MPSGSSGATAISSASPPGPTFSRRKSELGVSAYTEDDGDVLNTPGEKQWDGYGPETPSAARTKRGRGTSGATKGANLTLRDQEKHIDNLKKENFNVKLRVHFLEERLAMLAPDQIEVALKQNITLKIEVQQRGMEMKKLKKLVLELEKELKRLQQRGSGGSSTREQELEELLEEREQEIRDLRRRRVDGDDDINALRDHNALVEDELENVKHLLEQSNEEMERLQDIVEARGDESTREGSERWRRRVEELEGENEDLLAKLDEQGEAITQREDEKEDMVDEIEALRLDLEEMQRRRDAEAVERSESRAQIIEERGEREAVEDDLNALRDKLAAATIELQQREDENEMKSREIDELVEEHERIVEVVEQEWRGEVEEARGQVEELRDVLAERETESKELRLNISELEANTNDLHEKFEQALAHLEQESDDKDSEIAANNEEIQKLGDQVYALEEENDKIRDEYDRLREDDISERERLAALSAALKEKLTTVKGQLQEMTELYEQCSEEIHAHRSRQEELARHVEDLVTELNREREARERLQSDFNSASKEHDSELRRERRALEAKESALQSVLNEQARAQALMSQRESDLAAVQGSLQTIESESKRLGETHTTARFSLQLEVDRLKRDLERLEDELTRARKDLDDRETKSRDRDTAIDRLHAENRDLTTQLAAQTQARLNASEKLDGVQGSLRTAESEVATFRSRVNELESRLSKDQRSLLSAESQYRDQLTERNTLLLTIYQYMDKILGVDKTPKKGGQAETKPFTNFSVFHDNLITRLKALSQIQLDFDRRCREVENRFTEKLTDMRKQLDNRWKQIDKFESSVKTYADTKVAWRRKLSAKEGELEAIKATNTDMATQLASQKRPGQGDGMEVRALSARATNAERRLINAQNQLAAAEEKMATMNQRNTNADGKWEARVKEYETRLKAAEERVKRERQGSKERVAELENNLKSLQRQFELAQKRNQQLNEVIDTNKVSGSPGR
ncbi:hypothetical protein FIBSPDRAFT_749256 [Athelia psychrophila]|uniref:CARD domain-containing protein n=1 Tax=Athelia psychrophila TaxID=1759441 RepID=A0A166ETE5_9AGAM|nr:hypothetical protein FIBSPDRAFT_749256 [Fibularhizoctonia sp. CBS 109695]